MSLHGKATEEQGLPGPEDGNCGHLGARLRRCHGEVAAGVLLDVRVRARGPGRAEGGGSKGIGVGPRSPQAGLMGLLNDFRGLTSKGNMARLLL